MTQNSSPLDSLPAGTIQVECKNCKNHDFMIDHYEMFMVATQNIGQRVPSTATIYKCKCCGTILGEEKPRTNGKIYNLGEK